MSIIVELSYDLLLLLSLYLTYDKLRYVYTSI